MKIIFFYPGGQGSQEQAQPLLDDFSQALSKASGGKIQAQISYISDLHEGKTFVQTQKPVAGILSLDVYYQEARPWNLLVLAKTLQLPAGDGTDQYFIVGSSRDTLPTSGSLKILSSRALDPGFVQKKLFSQLPLRLEVAFTPNIVLQLRKIGRGETHDWVLLDQFEYNTISRSNADWAKHLKAAAQSPKVPSAPFVVFQNNLSQEQSGQLLNALLKLSRDPEAQPTLELLRLKGFQKATGDKL